MKQKLVFSQTKQKSDLNHHLKKGLIVLVSPEKLDRKGKNKVSKCNIYLGNTTKERSMDFAT